MKWRLNTTVGSGDAASSIADKIVSEINQKLQPVVTGSNASGVITITAVDPGSLFSVVCSVSAGATETYSILSHEPALRSAFNLTGDEFALISFQPPGR